jgi:hypothetical protein
MLCEFHVRLWELTPNADRYSTLSGYKQAIKKLDVTARESVIWGYKIAVDQSLLLMPRSLTMDHPDTPHSPNMNGTLFLKHKNVC